jgi:putative transposase
MEKFAGTYRIPSARWVDWDYAANGAYFVTICTFRRTHDFGEIAGGEMILTPSGQAAAQCWTDMPIHFPFVVVNAFVVMPNHVHGIILIDKPGDVVRPSTNKFGPQSENLASIVRGYKIGVTKFARQHNIPFDWQARYHDHVIRNDGEYKTIWDYVQFNPQKWADDIFHN